MKVRLKIGAPPADGDYRVLAAISGGGHSAAGEAAATVRIERPVVRLALDTLGLLNAANGATVAVIPFTIGL